MGCTPEYILRETSFENLVLYGYATPSYDFDDKVPEWDESKDANNPANTFRRISGVIDED